MKGITQRILKILFDEHKPLSTGEILIRMGDEYEGTHNNVASNIHSMLRRRLLIISERIPCKECGTPHQLYKLSDKGKVQL